jgi:dihydrofolate reductase
MSISLIVAMAHDRVIGAKNKMPWHLPADLKRFKKITQGHPILMGRKTYESIGKPLPGRTSIVISRQLGLNIDGALTAPSLDHAITKAKTCPGSDEIFVIGGGEIFKEAISLAQKIYLTHIELDVNGDTFFPEIIKKDWKSIQKDFYPATDMSPAFLFETLEKS